MFPVRSLLYLLVVVLFALGPSVQGASLPKGFLKQLAKVGVPTSAVSVFVQRVDQDKPRLSVNADKALNPASVIKVVTTMAALDILGPDYTWRTKVYIDGRRDGDKLLGNLILKGEGDPYFTPEQFWQLLYNVRSRGIREIDGDVILDASQFESPKGRRADFDGKPHRAYNALPYALSLNFQAVQITVEPDERKKGLRVLVYPPLDNLRIENKAKLVKGKCTPKLSGPVVNVTREAGIPTVELTGRMASGCDEAVFDYLLNTPNEQITGSFSEIWRQLGGSFTGQIKAGELTDSARLVAEQHSRPLAHAIWGVNKFSNNLMARHTLLTLAAENGDLPATPAAGVARVKRWMTSMGVKAPGLVIVNGAGLARETRISAQTLGELLLHAYRGPRMPELLASLPIVGKDGTTRRRMRRHPIAGRAHIKTGSIDHVSALAGYVLDKNGHRWVVASLINHRKLRWYGRLANDELLSWVYKGAQ